MSAPASDPALAELRDRVRAAAAARTPLCIRGGGTKDFYGQPQAGEPLEMRGWHGIVGYEPTELVITARCGTPLAEVEAALAERGQMLAFEPPAFGAAATIGGVIAAGLSGPRRASAGAARDFVLGATLLDAAGRELRFGGQVMKNVAGYDVSRLACGSLGILGPILEVSLKVLPLPAAEASLRLPIDEAGALRAVNEWGGQPLPLSASAWCEGVLSLRLSGAAAAVEAAVARFEREHGTARLDPAQARAYWAGVREQTDAFFDGAQPLWRLSLPATAPVVDLPGARMFEWGGALRWLRSDASAETVRAAVSRLGGTATLFRGGDRAAGVFHPLAPINAALQRRLKDAFDPARIFNPGRMYPDL
ncbi:MAG: glycolate oxidase subunit GlcE [Lautropia sp.]|nr:glycolate oxidase subunit GlcE [Lautropia sp.]MDL1906455.1 glycolate oxidase subunit GlcE [Betaproteobacteria bacterium PRO1]RIK90128.1 MAG: glycolate oxidase subunit GlcE [Burkholderiales bacterium]